MAKQGTVPEEVPASIEDFFSDERDSSSSSGGDDDFDQMDQAESERRKKKKKVAIPSHALPSVDITPQEFRKRGKELIDFIADYMEGTRDTQVNHQVIPGYLFRKMAGSVPKEGCSFDDVIKDVQEFVLPGLSQWQSPKHHALMPLGGSYASLLGSILCDGLGCASLTWNECPASVEMEMVVMNWLAELMDLPLDFRFFGKSQAEQQAIRMSRKQSLKSGNLTVPSAEITAAAAAAANAESGQNSTSATPTSGGGGIIQTNTTECLLTVMAAAKRRMLEYLKTSLKKTKCEWEIQNKMLAYCSEQAHPCMERVCEINGVHLKRLWTDRQGTLHSSTLLSVMQKDKANGYFPFIMIATAGTIASAAVDQMDKIGPLLGQGTPRLWFHIDASYAGNAFICREYQPLLHGVNYADSINVTVHKWLPVHMDCACLWVKKVTDLIFTFACEDPDGPLTIPRDDKNMMADYRNWSLPMSRRFRAMKIWMVFKLYGYRKLQQKIREDVRRAKELEKMINEDHRFEILAEPMFGIVTFRCKRPDLNAINLEILHQINKSAVIKMTGARVGNKFWLRFVVAGRYTDSEDVRFSWEMVKRLTGRVVMEHTERSHNENRSGVPNYQHVIRIGQETRLDDKEVDPKAVKTTE